MLDVLRAPSHLIDLPEGQKLKTAKSSGSKVASEASRKIWHGALKKKRQDCPALREGVKSLKKLKL